MKWSLAGQWQFRPEGEMDWRAITVPGCWENIGIPHDWEGPGWYRRVVEIPHEGDERLWLRFDAVSYACEVWVNGVSVGTHRGAWDAFALDITPALGNATQAEILMRVVKPGGVTYPTKQTTAGFLPYVWGYLFGGIWQDVTLEASDADPLLELYARPIPQRVTVQGNTPCLDGKPFYPRMPLSWGWYRETLHANPPVEVMRAELEKIQSLGYNGVKCCLWVPPPAYLDLCDAMGLLVWLELPLWLPEMNAEQREQVFSEYETIVKQVRHHPCIVLWTLGCELSTSCPDAFLSQLYARVKEWSGSPLVRDNSGGGECYGGLLKEYADYYDYHFYCDLHFLRNTFDYFLPHGRPKLPWFFGEFCDADAFRDLLEIRAAYGGALPWWASDDPARNPQGARWDMNILGQWANSEKYDLFARREELKEGQRRQTLLHRKFTVELVRTYREMSGYVITGLVDTPISIAGMYDDFGTLRYTPEEFCRFNADTMLFLGWHRRRNWVAGGDRPSYIDHWCHWSGETLLPRIGLSHYGADDDLLSAKVILRHANGAVCAEAELSQAREARLPAGTVRPLGMAEIVAPSVERMTKFFLCAEASLASGLRVVNEWPLWVVPEVERATLPKWLAYDPGGKLAGLERHGVSWESALREDEDFTGLMEFESHPAVASRWHASLTDFAWSGGRAFVFVDRGGGLPVVECPFWREAMKLFEPHPIWDAFPHEGFTDLQFYGLAADCALDRERLAGLFPGASLRSVLQRVDARTFVATDYLAEVHYPSGGRLLLTTLRPQGGLGDQPDGLLRHVAGVHFLTAALRYLTAYRPSAG